jgi:hypothetical protein
MTSLAYSPERRGPRFTARIPVRYQVFDLREGHLEVSSLAPALARDIGSNGLFLQLVSLPVGTRVHFFFELPESYGGCVEAWGEVVHTHARPDFLGNLLGGVGVRVQSISSRDRMRLDQYLAERQKIDNARRSAHQVRLRAEARVALRAG